MTTVRNRKGRKWHTGKTLYVNINILTNIHINNININNTSSKGEKPCICGRPIKPHASRNEICLLYELPNDSKAFWACSDNLQYKVIISGKQHKNANVCILYQVIVIKQCMTDYHSLFYYYDLIKKADVY